MRRIIVVSGSEQLTNEVSIVANVSDQLMSATSIVVSSREQLEVTMSISLWSFILPEIAVFSISIEQLLF